MCLSVPMLHVLDDVTFQGSTVQYYVLCVQSAHCTERVPYNSRDVTITAALHTIPCMCTVTVQTDFCDFD